MKKSRILLILLCITTILLINLTGCSEKTTEEDTKAKINEELDYLDSKILGILNKLNNISIENYTITSEEISLSQKSETSQESSSGGSSSQEGESGGQQKQSNSQNQSSAQQQDSSTVTQMEAKTVLESDENDIDWKTIKNEIETINESWAIVILDLSNLNVDNSDILTFSSTLDECTLSIKDENKIDSLINVAKLYSIIPNLERGISNSNSVQNIKQVKSYIINAYSLVEQDNWAGIESNILEAEKIFKSIINDIEYVKDKEYKVNKAYVLIKELQNSLSYKDKKIFYIKYKNLMESINVMQ